MILTLLLVAVASVSLAQDPYIRSDVPGRLDIVAHEGTVNLEGNVVVNNFTLDALIADSVRRQFPCLSSPCQNAGTCTAAGEAFSCACTADFHGDNCAETVDLCASNPCGVGGVCTPSLGPAYTCACREPFLGATCSTLAPGWQARAYGSNSFDGGYAADVDLATGRIVAAFAMQGPLVGATTTNHSAAADPDVTILLLDATNGDVFKAQTLLSATDGFTERPTGVAAHAPSRRAYISGTSSGGQLFSSTPTLSGDIFVAVISLDTAEVLYGIQQGGTSLDEGDCVAWHEPADGGPLEVFVGGTTRSTVFPSSSTSQQGSAGYPILLKYIDTGTSLTLSWTSITVSPASRSQRYSGIAIDHARHFVYLTGSGGANFNGASGSSSDIDVIVAKFSTESNTPEWARPYGSTDTNGLRFDEGFGISYVAETDTTYIAGFSNGEFNGQQSLGLKDVLVMMVASNGTMTASLLFGSVEDEIGNAVQTEVSASGAVSVHIAGEASRAMVLPAGATSNVYQGGLSNGFLAAVAADAATATLTLSQVLYWGTGNSADIFDGLALDPAAGRLYPIGNVASTTTGIYAGPSQTNGLVANSAAPQSTVS